MLVVTGWEDKSEPFIRSAGSVIKDINLEISSSYCMAMKINKFCKIER